MGISDLLAGLSGAYKGGKAYDDDEETKARQKKLDKITEAMQRLQQLSTYDKLGMTPYTPEAALGAAMQGRPTDLTPTVGLTPDKGASTADAMAALVAAGGKSVARGPAAQSLQGMAPRASAPAGMPTNRDDTPMPPSDNGDDLLMGGTPTHSQFRSAVTPPPAQRVNPMDALTGSSFKAPDSISSLSTGGDARAEAMKALSGPRVTMPVIGSEGGEEEMAMYPGGAVQRDEDKYNARSDAIEKRQTALDRQKAQEKAAAIAAANEQDHELIRREYARTKDPMLAPYAAAHTELTGEGRYAKVWDAYQKQKDRDSQESRANDHDAAMAKRARTDATAAKHDDALAAAEGWWNMPTTGSSDTNSEVSAIFKTLRQAHPDADPRELMLMIQKGVTGSAGLRRTSALTGKTEQQTSDLRNKQPARFGGGGAPVAPSLPAVPLTGGGRSGGAGTPPAPAKASAPKSPSEMSLREMWDIQAGKMGPAAAQARYGERP